MECPDQFSADPEANLLCDLWTELENLNQQEGVESADQSNSLISTTGNLSPISCLYQAHSTSSQDLCQIWCQIQVFQVILPSRTTSLVSLSHQDKHKNDMI